MKITFPFSYAIIAFVFTVSFQFILASWNLQMFRLPRTTHRAHARGPWIRSNRIPRVLSHVWHNDGFYFWIVVDDGVVIIDDDGGGGGSGGISNDPATTVKMCTAQ